MSKKSRRRNRALGVIAGLMGAKALGLLGSKTAATSGASKIVGKTPEFRKSFVKPKAKVVQNLMPDVNKFKPKLAVTKTGEVLKNGKNMGVGNVKSMFTTSDGVFKGGKKVDELNPKSIVRTSSGQIKVGDKTFANKDAYASAMKAKRGKSENSLKSFMNKFVLGPKTQMKMGSMVKARGGGMARTKPTKMY